MTRVLIVIYMVLITLEISNQIFKNIADMLYSTVVLVFDCRITCFFEIPNAGNSLLC